MVSELDRFRQMSVAFVERKKQKLQEFFEYCRENGFDDYNRNMVTTQGGTRYILMALIASAGGMEIKDSGELYQRLQKAEGQNSSYIVRGTEAAGRLITKDSYFDDLFMAAYDLYMQFPRAVPGGPSTEVKQDL